LTVDPWYKHAFFYEVHPRVFYDANGDGIGDLQGLIKKLDYIGSLGADCIWLLPIYPSPLKDGGYDIADYYGVHPDLGTLDDFKQLVEACHQKGLRIIADLVVNHTSDECAWFQEAESDPTSKYHNYYVWSDTPDKYADTRIIFLDTEDSNWAWSEKAGKYYWHRFYSSQPDLNYDNPDVREEMKRIMRFWLDMGIDGFRADAVPYLIEREGTNCENLPETHAYLKEMRLLIEEEYPGCILLAEANQWPADLMPYFSSGDEFHMAFNFPIMPRMFKSVALGDAASLVEIIENIPTIPENCQWCTFLRNHDELTLEMVTESDRQLMWELYAPEKRMRLNQGIRRRLAPLLDGDSHKIALMVAILFSIPGAPVIYYGDEIGMGDSIWLEDRDGVRTPMQWNETRNAGFSDAEQEDLFLPVIDTGPYCYQKVNVKSQQSSPDSLFNRIQSLVAIRKAHRVFNSQSFRIIVTEKPGVFSILRSNGDEAIWCFHNISDCKQEISLKKGSYAYLHGSACKEEFQISAGGEITLAPYGYVWLLEG